VGLSKITFSQEIVFSEIRALNLDSLNSGKSIFRAKKSKNIKPTLWRVLEYCSPGFHSQTIIFIKYYIK
jgi:hypothetical protein